MLVCLYVAAVVKILEGNCLDVDVCVHFCIWRTQTHTHHQLPKNCLSDFKSEAAVVKFYRQIFGCRCVCTFVYLKDTKTHASSTSKILSFCVPIMMRNRIPSGKISKLLGSQEKSDSVGDFLYKPSWLFLILAIKLIYRCRIPKSKK